MTAIRRTALTTRDLLLLALPHGGQLTSRRNAWAAMSEGATRARGRRDANVAMDQAIRRSQYAAPTRVAQ